MGAEGLEDPCLGGPEAWPAPASARSEEQPTHGIEKWSEKVKQRG
jgi:hypothetical protein